MHQASSKGKMFFPYKIPPRASGDKEEYNNEKEKDKHTKLLVTSSVTEEHFYKQFYFYYDLPQEHEQTAQAGSTTQEFGSLQV